MRKIIGRILQVLGWGCVGWFGVVGGGFSAIYLFGFIATIGREYGGELSVVLPGTVCWNYRRPGRSQAWGKARQA